MNEHEFRQHLAGCALQGLLSNPKLANEFGKDKDGEWVGETCWAFADHVIKGKAKRDTEFGGIA